MKLPIPKPAHVLLIFLAVAANAPVHACALKDPRICDIDARLRSASHGHVVTYSEDGSTAPGVAAEYEWTIGAPDIVHLGRTRDFDDNELFFLVAHEFGHSALHHGRELAESVAAPGDRPLPDLALLGKYSSQVQEAANTNRELNHRQELEADAFAVRVMLENSADPIPAMRSVLTDNPDSATHPSRRKRLAQAAYAALGARASTIPGRIAGSATGASGG